VSRPEAPELPTREGVCVCVCRHTQSCCAASRPRATPCSQYGGLLYLTSFSVCFIGCTISICSAISSLYAVRTPPFCTCPFETPTAAQARLQKARR
jgi:hypothetical protein